MSRAAVLGIAAAAALAGALAAPRAAAAQDFDYWLLALSWSPSWCYDEPGRLEDAEQCDPRKDFGFVLHGLWPQFETGWPEYCDTARRDPSRRQTAAMADVTGGAGLAWHAWNKHGTCSDLEAADYFALSRFAFGLMAKPDLADPTTAAEVEDAFLAANPGLDPDALVVTCRDGAVREVRICLSRDDLAPRPCGADVSRAACRARGPLDAPPPP
jgi:ribonuclease T2